MSTTERGCTLPPLIDGERLDRATFHERYVAMPPDTRAQLIGGVVVIRGRTEWRHAQATAGLASWLSVYSMDLRELRPSAACTIMLDDQAEPEPDLHLRVRPEYGGQTSEDGEYLSGAPELVIEVTVSSTRAADLGLKFADYERTGVLEYLVVSFDPDEVHWFGRRGDRLVPLKPEADGVYRSELFPGLWLDPALVFDHDVDGLFKIAERGRLTPEFAAFRADLAARRSRADSDRL